MHEPVTTLVVTSVNPFSKLDYQRLCFQRWRSLGMDVVTCNTRAEAEILRKNGFQENEIRYVADHDSGQNLFGKAVPLIRPLLASLEHETRFESFLITNSDIYPAVRSGTVAHFWAAQAPALALTREETPELSAHDYDSESPYRGGLDAFFLRHAALRNLNRLLANSQASPRMAFGAPGWDYLLGACILSPEIGGRLLDSHVLLHQSHQATYGNMSEFGHYVPDLQRLGAVSAGDPSAAAAEFSAMIDQQCRHEMQRSRLARLLYYKRPERMALDHTLAGQFENCWDHLVQIAPAMGHYYRKRTMASLYQRITTDSSASLDTAASLLCNSKSTLFAFNQSLFSIVFVLLARAAQSPRSFVRVYPKGNQHGPALRNILTRHDENDPRRRFWIARLFGSELVDHSIFNPRLYKYVVLASDNDCELDLVLQIKALIQGKLRNAA